MISAHVFCDVTVTVLVHQLEQLLSPCLLPHELFVREPSLHVQLLAGEQLLCLVTKSKSFIPF